jgi:HAD superfamily hydrolase (TIGR01509 family)
LKTDNLIVNLLSDKKLLIFDFDGTIADTSPIHEMSFNKILSPWDVKVNYSDIAGMRTNDAFKKIFFNMEFDISEFEIQALTLQKQLYVRVLMHENLQTLPGVDQFLRWARLHFPLAIYSSGSRQTVKLALEILGFNDWFSPVICSEDVVQAKPHPEGYLRVLELSSILAKDALIFEDSNFGIEAAKLAKIPYIDVRISPFTDFLRSLRT